MKTSEAGIELIKKFEGLELNSYQDIAGIWTIGYGHTETAGPDQRISENEAEALLRRDLKPREDAVSRLTSVPLNQNEFDALVSFVYNVGIEAYRGSTARKRLNRGDRIGAADALTWWNKATVNGVLREVLGLTRRRAAEKALFLTPVNAPIVNDPTNVSENSRAKPLEDAPRRENLGESRTVQGAAVAGGAGVAATSMGRDSAEELHEIETNIETGESLTDNPDGLGSGAAIDAPADDDVASEGAASGDVPDDVANDVEAPGDDVAVADAETSGTDSETTEEPSEETPEITQSIEAPPPRPSAHEKHVVEAQMQLALMILILLSVGYILLARVDDWFRYRR